MENSIKLSDGSLIPRVGFGTYLLNGYTGVNAISSALNNGYRFLDSAFNMIMKPWLAKRFAEVMCLEMK